MSSLLKHLLSWKHSGFSVDNSIRIYGNDDKTREALSQVYCQTACVFGKDNVRANSKVKCFTRQPNTVIIFSLWSLCARWFLLVAAIGCDMEYPLGRFYNRLLLELEKNRILAAAGTPYTFEFGPKELINVVGISMEEGQSIANKLFENKKIKVVDNRIFISDGSD